MSADDWKVIGFEGGAAARGDGASWGAAAILIGDHAIANAAYGPPVATPGYAEKVLAGGHTGVRLLPKPVTPGWNDWRGAIVLELQGRARLFAPSEEHLVDGTSKTSWTVFRNRAAFDGYAQRVMPKILDLFAFARLLPDPDKMKWLSSLATTLHAHHPESLAMWVAVSPKMASYTRRAAEYRGGAEGLELYEAAARRLGVSEDVLLRAKEERAP